MASLIEWLYLSGARDEAGLPIATGTAYFYVPGSTSEAITVYADAAATTPLSQPVTLDAAGRATVYAKVQCEILIKDSLGSTKRTATNAKSLEAAQVNVPWGDSTVTLESIMADIKSTTTYSESTATGVVARTPQEVLRQFISPYDFGADGGGSVDDTTPLQNAIARAIATGFPLNLEVGTYRITAPLTITAPVNVYGAGVAKSIIQSTSESTGHGLSINIVAAGAEKPMVLRDFSVLLPHTTSAAKSAIYLTAVEACTFERLRLTGGYGMRALGTMYGCVVTGCVATYSGSSSVSGNGFSTGTGCILVDYIARSTNSVGNLAGTVGFYPSSASALHNCQSYNAEYGFSVWGSAYGCYANGCTTDFKDIASGTLENCSSTNCDNSTYGIQQLLRPGFNGQSSASSTPSLAFDPTNAINAFKFTYSGTISIANITWPSEYASLTAGTQYTIVIACAVGTAISAVNFDSFLRVQTGTLSVRAEHTQSAQFVVTSDRAHLMQVTAWMENGLVGW